MKWSPQQDNALTQVARWHRQCLSELLNGTALSQPIFRVFGFAGTGKAQPTKSLVATPSGWREIGSLKVGDQIFGADGNPHSVTGVYPQGAKRVCRVTFRDGSSAKCCEDHLWRVKDSHQRWRVIPLREIARLNVKMPSGGYRFQIPLSKPVKFLEKKLPIDPYVLGVLIGDGYISGSAAVFSTPDIDQDIAEMVRQKLPEGYSLKKCTSPACPRYTIKKPKGKYRNEILSSIREFGLNEKSGKRFIPEIYLTSSIEQRTSLLRGLMDTDGTCQKNRTTFSTTSSRLADGVVELVQSLGGTAIRRPVGRKREITINVKIKFNPFNCRRKSSKWSPSSKNPPSRYIVGIECIGFDECVCISVSSDDNLYLTENYIVTHNTTLARYFANSIDGNVTYSAFTGKAAMVMRQAGCADALTIHSLIYSVEQNENTGRITFDLNPKSDVKDAALNIVDECSQVYPELGQDFLSFGRPILVLGDPFQLPPVKSDYDDRNGTAAGFFTEHEPDVMLTEIHRQAEEDPIVRLATDIREGRNLRYGLYGDSKVINPKTITALMVNEADQVLVGRNLTRQTYNRRIREIKRFDGVFPNPGERIICLKNNRSNGIFNGGMFEVVEVDRQSPVMKAKNRMKMAIKPLDYQTNNAIEVECRVECWTGGLQEVDWQDKRGADEFDYGYAMTVHKAQGSQWDHTVLFDESGVFRSDWRRHLYTGITRASKSVTIVR